MSSVPSTSRAPRIARSTAASEPGAKEPKPKRPSTLKKVTKSLRETLLSKKLTASRTSISEESDATSEMEPSPATIDEKMAAWPQQDPDDAAKSRLMADDESVGSDSLASDPHPAEMSMFYTPSSKKGVEMSMANRRANEILQRGKEALESAGNMKRECKLIATESLQSLYEMVLALSDSRARHMLQTERERSRHAIELVRVERACNKELTDWMGSLTKELSMARQDARENLDKTKAVKGWLEFENVQEMEELGNGLRRIEKRCEDLAEKLAASCVDRPSEAETSIQNRMLARLESLSMQMDGHRRDISKLSECTKDIQLHNSKTIEILESHPTLQDATPPTPDTNMTNTNQELDDIRKTLTLIMDKLNVSEPPSTHLPLTTSELTTHLQPLTEKLRVVSSEIKIMREAKEAAPPPPMVSIGAELALAELAKTPKPTLTYAQKLKEKPPPKPNHTLIVSSTDPQKTGEKVIEAIRVSLDAKKTGVRVDRVRKARNQKVVLSCGTPEDLALLQRQIKTDKTLKVEKAHASNPLVRIRDVLSYHTDAEILEHIKAQNKSVFQGVPVEDSTLKVRYRKRARNQHECHPVLEVSPTLYKRMMEVEKLYIGLQRRPVEDQSPLVQCTKCLGFGHTKAVCRERVEACSFCGENHCWEKCPNRLAGKPPACKNCRLSKKEAHDKVTPTVTPAHVAFSYECPERQKWDAIARSRVAYC